MRTVSLRLADLERSTIPIGFQDENLHTQVRIDCKMIFKDYPAAVVSLAVTPPQGDPYPVMVIRDGDIVAWNVTASDTAYHGEGRVQFTFVDGEEVIKTVRGKTNIAESDVPSGTAPPPIQNWITIANVVLDEVAHAIEAALHAPIIDDNGYWAVWDADAEEYVATEYKAQGTDGHDGVGIVSIEKTGTSGLVDTYTITFTSGNPVTYTVTNGRDGNDGISPIATVTKSGKVATITITDKNGTTSETVSDGADADPTALIDDTAGSGATGKTWSADKIAAETSALLTEITNGNAPIVKDKSDGSNAFFRDGSDNRPIDNLKIRINPVQTGSGDPAPNNVRAISGSTSMTIYHSGVDTSDPSEIEVSWQTEAGTVYYGNINAITGALTVEAIALTFDGSSDESWNYISYSDYNKYKYYINVSSSGIAHGANKQDVVACNWLKPILNGGHSVYDNGTNVVDMSSGNSALLCIALNVATVELLKAALATTPLVVVAKLATPQTYTVDGISLNTLYGENHIWTNVGEIIQCDYKADTKLYVRKSIDEQEVETQFQTKAATLTDGTIKAFEDIQIRKNLDIDFKGDITSFTSVTMGHGYNQDAAAYIVVDNTNVTVYKESGTQLGQYAHNLTIGTYIHVMIQQMDDTTANVVVGTLSGEFRKTGIKFNGCDGDIFATVSGTLTNVSISAVIHDINKPIWFFGDSYQSLEADASARWPYYYRRDGYMNNALFSGRYGTYAQFVLPAFKKLVEIKRPKYVVWCLGMNGADVNGEINYNWKVSTDEVIRICAEKEITLILATIPCTPSRDNTYKNAYVKQTGLRYIDFAHAVGAEQAESSWYTGMLNEDNLHPTATGALALYSQILADFPEAMMNHGMTVWEGGSY